MDDAEPIHVYIPGRPDDPRRPHSLPDGVEAHHGPPLHPDDVTILDGIPVTSVARTLIDLAEVMDADELRGCFVAARERGSSTSISSRRLVPASSGDRPL